MREVSRVQQFIFTVTRAINNIKYGFDGTNKPFLLSPHAPSRQTQIDNKVSRVIGGLHFFRDDSFWFLFRKIRRELFTKQDKLK